VPTRILYTMDCIYDETGGEWSGESSEEDSGEDSGEGNTGGWRLWT